MFYFQNIHACGQAGNIQFFYGTGRYSRFFRIDDTAVHAVQAENYFPIDIVGTLDVQNICSRIRVSFYLGFENTAAAGLFFFNGYLECSSRL